IYPSGETATLLSVPKYDFNWQLGYELEKPMVLPKGTRIECTAHFDNSINNPHNPDPTKAVKWGDQTWEEMMIGWFGVSVDPQAKTRGVDKVREPGTAHATGSARRRPARHQTGRLRGWLNRSKPAVVQKLSYSSDFVAQALLPVPRFLGHTSAQAKVPAPLSPKRLVWQPLV